MLNRVLIAEDFESTNLSVQHLLLQFGIKNIESTYYCDDAFSKIRKSLKEEEPFDLLITDLNFEEDHYHQHLKGGEDLIRACKAIVPNLKILVFSANQKSAIIERLVANFKIDGFVRKARMDTQSLIRALEAIQNGEQFFSEDIKDSIRKLNTFEFSTYDILLIELLAMGLKIKDMPIIFEQRNIKPSGMSSIEKRISMLKDSLGLPSNTQLVTFCKDLGII